MAETKSKDAISLLKQDHREVEQMFKEYQEAKGDGRKEKLARQICSELIKHAIVEEEIFYPACKGVVDEDQLKEAYVEHDAAKLLIAELEKGSPKDEYFDAKVKVLCEEIEHHVEEEERWLSGIFAEAKRSDLDMDAIGEQILKRKAELKKEMGPDNLPKPELTTMTAVSD